LLGKQGFAPCAACTRTSPNKNAANSQPEKSLVQEPDLLSLFVRPLEKAGMRYLVAGSVGAMHYSEPQCLKSLQPALSLTVQGLLEGI
jgi:hypothetical protein